jgi:uncharacterized membrane protein YqjE
MTFGGLLYLAAIVSFILVALGIWAFDMDVRDAIGLLGVGLACLAAAGTVWTERRIG